MLSLRFRLVFLCFSCVWLVCCALVWHYFAGFWGVFLCGFTVVLLRVRFVLLCFACTWLVCRALFAVFFAMVFEVLHDRYHPEPATTDPERKVATSALCPVANDSSEFLIVFYRCYPFVFS